jgi:hypothetical protein
MRSVDLPEMLILARSSDLQTLKQALTEVLNGALSHELYRYVNAIKGTARSVRVLSPEPYMDCVSLHRGYSPEEMAAELLRLGTEEARYDPPEKPGSTKGWEVRKLKQYPIAIAYAAWTD